jgi:heme a synthase
MEQFSQTSSWVRVWLWAIALLIFAMVIVGGATRLTDSGLSITEWQPLLGAIPPMNLADWQDAFLKYQQIPEFKILNRGMSLDEFKFIYWWEWAHRFLGRFIGLAFVIPLLIFIATKKLPRRLWGRLSLLFVLGGLQGALGWYMVASGLSERTDVSQYRLAAHLSLAFALFAAVVWTVLGLDQKRQWCGQKSSWLAVAILVGIAIQIAAGGFVAGLDAGHASYTWPLMLGSFVPEGMTNLQPIWLNWFENALAVQFNHRMIAYVLLALITWQAFAFVGKTTSVVLIVALSQMTLGILTVVWEVPLSVALIHQGGALILLATALWNLHVLLRASDGQLTVRCSNF